MNRRFEDRRQAGRELGERLSRFRGREDVVVLGLPRGGVPVAFEVAAALDAELDVFVVRKLGVPGHEELALGAVGSGGVLVVNDDIAGPIGATPRMIRAAALRQLRDIDRSERRYRGDREPVGLRERTVLLVDDGLATGATMFAAVAGVRQLGAGSIAVAVPVAASQTCSELRDDVDGLVCLLTPDPFGAVGLWYHDFGQTTDAEVRELIALARVRTSGASLRIGAAADVTAAPGLPSP